MSDHSKTVFLNAPSLFRFDGQVRRYCVVSFDFRFAEQCSDVAEVPGFHFLRIRKSDLAAAVGHLTLE